MVEQAVVNVCLKKNMAKIRTWISRQEMEGMYLYYGFGLDPYANITDARGRDIPCVGPIKLEMK